jgi:hypothetical protein
VPVAASSAGWLVEVPVGVEVGESPASGCSAPQPADTRTAQITATITGRTRIITSSSVVRFVHRIMPCRQSNEPLRSRDIR